MVDFLLSALYSIPAIVIAISFHEWAHAYSAYKLGDPTARNLGRMTVDPTKHIDLLGLLAMFIVHFGWAKPVPINPNNFKKPRRDEIIVSLAGVFVNFLLGFLFYGVYILLQIFVPNLNEAVQMIVLYLYLFNVGFMIFNLLPIPPLDGYHVLKNALIRKVDMRFFWKVEQYQTYILIGLLLISYQTGFVSIIIGWVLHLFELVYGGIFGLFF